MGLSLFWSALPRSFGKRGPYGDEAVEELKEYRERQNYADNDATAAGKVCELCGSVITDGQPARLRPEGGWIHEACPISR